MYFELIQKYMKENQWVRPQAPAGSAQIQEAEKALQCSFPKELKQLFSEMDGDRWLLFSIEQMIENNQIYREDSDGKDAGRFLFFGTNGCGDNYGYRVLPDGAVDSSAVYRLDHETGEEIPVAADIYDLIRRYYNNEI